MRTKHPGTELIPYLRGELPPPDREQVAAHLAGCADCQRAVTEFRGLLDDLAKSVPQPPDLHWGRYQADLRDRLEARRRRRWWFKPVPLTLSAGLAGVLLFLTVQVGVRQVGPPQDSLTAFEETVLGSQLDLLRRYTLLERLDLLEDDLDLIGQLDGLVATGEV